MALICFIGIFIGSFSLALITAIMNGFQVEVHGKMQGIHAQVIIRGYGESLNPETLNPVLHNEFPEIQAFSPSSTRYTLVQTKEWDSAPIVAMVKGIDPIIEPLVSIIDKKIVTLNTHTTTFEEIFSENQVLIGKKLAKELGITVGDSIELLFTSDEQPGRRKITFDTNDAIVGGIFDTGIEEFDSGLIFVSFDFLQKLFPDIGIEQVNVKLQQNVDESVVVEKLQQRLDLEVYSWKDLYPALVSALKLEKYVTFFILALITLVASMNIISLMFMQIMQKRPDIAILKTLGMSNTSIMGIFLGMGMILSMIASLVGLGLSVLASLLLQYYPFIELPDVYYVSHLPVRMEWQILITVFVVVMLLSFFATWVPARKIKYINIAEVLRFEG